jgi:hypothetical protein
VREHAISASNYDLFCRVVNPSEMLDAYAILERSFLATSVLAAPESRFPGCNPDPSRILFPWDLTCHRSLDAQRLLYGKLGGAGDRLQLGRQRPVANRAHDRLEGGNHMQREFARSVYRITLNGESSNLEGTYYRGRNTLNAEIRSRMPRRTLSTATETRPRRLLPR